MHGIVTFVDKASVDAVMKQRNHRIDGKEVFIHRSVPNQGSLKNSYGIQQLIVSIPSDRSLPEKLISQHFEAYGKIVQIDCRDDEKEWKIDFD